MIELSEIAIFRIMLVVCIPSIIVLAFAPIGWMVSTYCRIHKDDKTSPSFVLSYLWETSEWYVSVCRYKEKFAANKVVVYKAKHAWLTVAVAIIMSECFKEWWRSFKTNKGNDLAVTKITEYINGGRFNATQKMFLSSLRHRVKLYGLLTDVRELCQDPFKRIGDFEVLFSIEQRLAIVELALDKGR